MAPPGDGCLTVGVKKLRFLATTSRFNSLQRGGGRLHFEPTRDWHGVVVVQATVDDLGSGLGRQASETHTRSVQVIVEPVTDTPRLDFLCPQAQPFVSYGRACLEVRNCIGLSFGPDERDREASVWLSVAASDVEMSVSIGDDAPVRVHREGWHLELSGLPDPMRFPLPLTLGFLQDLLKSLASEFTCWLSRVQ